MNAVLYGFLKEDSAITGYLRINSKSNSDLYSIVDSVDDATKFIRKRRMKAKDYSPEKILEFISGESELSSWKFHIVNLK